MVENSSNKLYKYFVFKCRMHMQLGLNTAPLSHPTNYVDLNAEREKCILLKLE